MMKRLYALPLIFVPAFCWAQSSASPQDLMLRQITFLSRCIEDAYALHGGELHQLRMLGKDISLVFIQSCSAADAYIIECREAGRTEKQCYGDLKIVISDKLRSLDPT